MRPESQCSMTFVYCELCGCLLRDDGACPRCSDGERMAKPAADSRVRIEKEDDDE